MFLFLFCQRQLFCFFILGTNVFIGLTEHRVRGRGLLTRSMADPKAASPSGKFPQSTVASPWLHRWSPTPNMSFVCSFGGWLLSSV